MNFFLFVTQLLTFEHFYCLHLNVGNVKYEFYDLILRFIGLNIKNKNHFWQQKKVQKTHKASTSCFQLKIQEVLHNKGMNET